MAPKAPWPKAPAIYQIYPRSFADSNGDGIGDLAGITARLEHVAGLGVDAVWLSSIYQSPWADGGYDICNHGAIHPILGTMEDFDALVAKAHGLGLRVILDQVLNHTSCEHPWFLAALAGDEAMAARYLFRDARPDGTQPNNWISQFGDPAWKWAHQRRQFYFHQFLQCQPSLNLRNPDVMAAHRDQLRFWQSHGVDGFRFDAASSYLWNEALANNPVASQWVREHNTGETFNPFAYQEHLHDMLPEASADYAANLREWAGANSWLMAEMTVSIRSYEVAMAFCKSDRLNAAYTSDLPEGSASPATIADLLNRADPARTVKWLSSHDNPRHASGKPGEAAFLATLMAVLPGPWLIYQGEEWGLPQPDLAKDEVTDPFDLMYWPDGPGREGPRVPMPWDAEAPHFGFTDGKPWLPMRWNRAELRAVMADGGLADIYRDLLRLRREQAWDTAQVVRHDHGDDWLTLCLETNHGRVTAWFGWPGAAHPVTHEEAPLFSLGHDSGFRATICRDDSKGTVAA